MTRKMQKTRETHKNSNKNETRILLFISDHSKRKKNIIYRIIYWLDIVTQFLVCNNVNQTFGVLYDDGQKRKKPMARKPLIANQYQRQRDKRIFIINIEIGTDIPMIHIKLNQCI